MRRTDRKRKTNGGFTLVELICVIAIMAILIAVAVPSYQNMQNKSAEQVAMANARSEYSAGKAQQALVDAQVLKPDETESYDYDPISDTATWEGEIKRTPQHLTENQGRQRLSTNSGRVSDEGDFLPKARIYGTMGHCQGPVSEWTGTIAGPKKRWEEE